MLRMVPMTMPRFVVDGFLSGWLGIITPLGDGEGSCPQEEDNLRLGEKEEMMASGAKATNFLRARCFSFLRTPRHLGFGMAAGWDEICGQKEEHSVDFHGLIVCLGGNSFSFLLLRELASN
jgi:hypothetical protein